VGEDGESLATHSIHAKGHLEKMMNDDVSSTLLKKRENKI
jgi:hypothetical protein